MMKDLILKAQQTFGLFSKGDTVTVAFSGGADSVALLHALLSLKDGLGITVNAAHLNHCIRGEEADRDENFVKDFCKTHGVKLFCERLDVPKFSADNHLSLELAARELRYDFLNRVATGKIATAHTASDNLETLIFNLTRGTALKGLCGIPPKRGNIIRPIIFCSREDVENYCKINGLSYVTDSTNLQDDYSRNKIRHNIIPVLKQINPNVEYSGIRCSVSLNEDNTFLEEYTQNVVFSLESDGALSVGCFKDFSPSVAKRVIKQYFEICYPDVNIENNHINAVYNICMQNKGKTNLPNNIYAAVSCEKLSFFTNGDTNTRVYDINITEMTNVNSLFSNNLLDCDKIKGKLIVRTRKEGDSVRLYNRGCTKTLKKLFCENKIPLHLRETLPVIADEEGVVWIYSVGVAHRCAVTDSTKRMYKIEVFEKTGESNE